MKTTKDLILEDKYSIFPLKYNGIEFNCVMDRYNIQEILKNCIITGKPGKCDAEYLVKTKVYTINDNGKNEYVQGMLWFELNTTYDAINVTFKERTEIACDDCMGDGTWDCPECGQEVCCKTCDGGGMVEADPYFGKDEIVQVLTISLNQLELFD